MKICHLITSGEVMFAGGLYAYNRFYYLYTGYSYWTMSPYYWYYGTLVFVANADGELNNYNVNSNFVGLRPVINLRSDITINSDSDGTQNNPYVVQ